MRYFLEISFNGAAYHGWQIQPNAISVQEVLQDRLSILLRKRIVVAAAGRTDTGVHANQMFVHFDMVEEIENWERIKNRLNSFLPDDIAVHRLIHVPDKAHTRFNALSREYHYLISLRKNPFMKDYAWDIYFAKLDVEAMNFAAAKLLHHTNYKCFSRSKAGVRTYECTISKAVWVRDGDILRFEVIANRFLRNMVRAMVGTLVEVGKGRCSQEEFDAILHSDDRRKAGASAPAHGLYLNRIAYPKEIII